MTRYEARRGSRFLSAKREELDAKVGKVTFVLEHVDWGGYAKDESARLARRVGHDIAHLSLRAVRSIERLLTQFVRRLRSQSMPEMTARESMRPFVKTLADFKGHLEATRPEMPEIR